MSGGINLNNKKANIVYVITDQYRRQAMGFWNQPKYKESINQVTDPVLTPNIDEFANDSVVFTRAISNCPVCSPYRAMLMSGRFPENNGVRNNCKAGRISSLKEDITCFTDVLAAEGYNVGYIGKLHLDMPQTHFDKEGNYVGEQGEYYSNGTKYGDVSCWDMATPQGPKRHGVDYWYSYGTFDVHKNPHYWDNECVKHEPKKWSPIHEADTAIDYINNVNNVRDEEKPFCLFVSMNPPHGPYHKIEDTDEEMFNKYYSEDVLDNAEELLNRPNVVIDDKLKNNVRHYFSHITGVDRQFGRILKAIDDSGKKDNTIVVFTADHGEMMGSHGLMGKNVIYDEAFLIPFVMRYPDKLQNRIEDMMVGGPDVMPTMLGLAGLKDSIPDDLDGNDYSDILINPDETDMQKPKSALFIHENSDYQIRGVRTDIYSFSIERDSQGKLRKQLVFNNIEDPYQLNNLDFNDLDKETRLFLRQELGYWLKEANDLWYKEKIFSKFIIYPE